MYYLYRFAYDFILVYPFYTLIFSRQGQSESAIGLLLAIWSCSVLVFEVPMGLLSDRMTRRHVLLLSALAKAVGFALWLLPGGFWVMAAGFVFWGLSEALRSGTEEAWLYETLHQAGRPELYARIRGRGTVVGSLAIALAAPAGGWVAERWGMDPVLWASVTVSLFSALLVAGFGQPPRTELPTEDEADAARPAVLRDLLPALRDIGRKRSMLSLIVFSGALLVVAGVLDEWDPLFLTRAGLTPTLFGLWMTARLLAESAGAALAHRAGSRLDSTRRLIWAAALSALPLVGLGLSQNLGWLLPYALFYLVYALLGVLAETRIQERLHGAHRATILSLRSFLENAVGIVMILVCGGVGQAAGLARIWTLAGVYAIVLAGVLLGVAARLPHRPGSRTAAP